MNKTSILTLLTVAAAGTIASANTVYVSGSGSDINLCTITSPCRTFSGALLRTTANGIIAALDSSDFGLGAQLALNFPVTIDGGAHGAFYSGPNNASAIAISLTSSTAPATIRNISFLSGTGSLAAAISGSLTSSVLNLEKITVTTSDPTNINGIQLQMDPNSQANLTDVSVSGSSVCLNFSTSAIPVVASYSASLERVTASTCGSVGLLVQGNVTVRDSTFRNCNIGVDSNAVSATNSLIEHSQIVNNVTGLYVLTPNTMRMSDSVVANNTVGVLLTNGNSANPLGTFISYRNNVFASNGTDGAISLSTSLK
jgi:hypothetical protein